MYSISCRYKDVIGVVCGVQGERRAAAAAVQDDKENAPMEEEVTVRKGVVAEEAHDIGTIQYPGAWWKGKGKGKKHRQHAMRVAHYLSMMKEQYAEIDAYELAAETPSPYHGTVWHGQGSPGGTSASVRKQSTVFRRVSLGLQDALGWLHKQGSLLKSGRKSTSNNRNIDYNEARTPSKSKTMGTIAESDHDLDVDVRNILNDIQEKHKDPLMTPSLEDSFKSKLKIIPDACTPRSPDLSVLSPIEQLLRLCGQNTDVNSVITMDELLGEFVDLSSVKKVGEGTFGEAFSVGNIVFKIVPMEGDGNAQKTASDIVGEAAVSLALSKLRQASKNATSGFVETHGIGVCRGKYSKTLTKEWHRWDKLHTSENEPVDGYGNNQLYVVFMASNGGVDLERFKPRSFNEIKSILLQTIITLTVAENACEFEHRDLHWGNILIQRDGSQQIGYTLNGIDMVTESAGVRVTLIDFTLSRLTSKEGDTAYCDLSTDPEIFNGPQGDPQAEAYRQMRITVDDWKQYAPRTNAIWIEYLLNIMIHYKCPTNCKKADKDSLESLQKHAAASCSAEDILFHPFFAGMWSSSESM